MKRAKEEALRAFKHSKESDDSIEDALENLREVNDMRDISVEEAIIREPLKESE